MSEFGHTGIPLKSGGFIDSWGVGPFMIEAGGRWFRFEDSDRFGPALVKRNGDPLKNPWPGSRSPFWRAHRIWKRQGRRLEDGKVCKWHEPKPTILKRINKSNAIVVESGEEDGRHVFLDDALG